MNIYKLVRKITFSDGAYFYTPNDPYRIYERLLGIWWGRGKVRGSKKTHEGVFYEFGTIRFLKWVYQGIPEAFWKFNIYIDANEDVLRKSARNDLHNEIWINIKGKRKLKSVHIKSHVISDLRNKVTYMPSYKEIGREVSNWGDYKYNFGNVKQSVLRGGEVMI